MNNINKWLFFTAIIGLFALIYLRYKPTHQPNIPTKTNTLVVGTNIEFPPFSFIEDGVLTGFDIDLITEIAKQLGKEITFKSMAFDALLPEIQLGSIHVIAAGMTPTPERAQRVFFTKPHVAQDPLVIISSTTTPYKTLDELKGKTIAVNQGYSSDRFVSELPDITVNRLSSALISEGLLALQSSRADAYVASKSSVQPYFDKFGNTKFVMHEIPNTQETYAFAVSKQHPTLFNEISKVLEKIEQSGILQTLKKKWRLE